MSIFVGLAMIVGQSGIASAADEYTLIIKDHKFEPAEISIPANTKVKLVVKNMDPTPEEFESHKLHREKVIKGNSQAVIYIGPLSPGTYPFFGEFHEDTAKGQIIVK
ncbi:MAG: cupredoxin domain-containing protein [Gammaproteobacteria bacterium]|nr:cupredoxin domain-containing protein [Gammaproteobacteria bacterium]